MDKGCSRSGVSLSEGALLREPGGGLLYWEPWRMCKGRHWGRASLSIGARWGTWKGAHLPGTLRDG